MARSNGENGSVVIGTATAIAGIRQWHMVETVKTEEGAGFDSGGWSSPIACMKSWNGDFDGFKDGAPITIGTEVSLTLSESAATGQVSTGQGIITDWEETVTMDGLITYKYTFIGKGTLTIATA